MTETNPKPRQWPYVTVVPIPRTFIVTTAECSASDGCHIWTYRESLKTARGFRTIDSERRESMLCAGLPPHIYESLKTLCCLANASAPLQAHEIASEADLPPAQTAKILQLMTWAGFVESRRGTKGGYWLAKSAKDIRVTDVTDFFSHRTYQHTQRKQNGLLKALKEATARCRKEFSRVTVADLAKVCKCRGLPRSRVTRVVRAHKHQEPMSASN
jgi:Rrf2 family cysteine metabolism transcriptional repressor